MTFSKLRFTAFALVFALFFAGLGAGSALAIQGHMLNARSYLNSAWSQLNMATSDKAGHRIAAMRLVNQAIYQVNLGIRAGAQ